MGNVLYQVPAGPADVILLVMIPVLMLLFVILMIESRRIRRGAGIFVCIFLGISAVAVFIGQFRMYNAVVGAYKSGQYEIVEGYVENFVPMPKGGHSYESFEIDGVYFAYSDNNAMTGYHNAKANGGVIRGDGQYLKVGYVYYNETYGNIIVYIEELQPQT